MDDRYKFRAFNKKTQKMFSYEELKATTFLIGNEETVKCGVFYPFESESFVFMQCTGLRDKNDKLIFEGDVVGVVWGSDPEYGLSDDDNSEYLEIKDIRYIPKIKGSNVEYCEIIGNIYDNPELLIL